MGKRKKTRVSEEADCPENQERIEASSSKEKTLYEVFLAFFSFFFHLIFSDTFQFLLFPESFTAFPLSATVIWYLDYVKYWD